MKYTLKPDHSEARRLIEKGFHLVPLLRYSKQPEGDNWNAPDREVKMIDDDATGYGMPLSANGLCSVDPDRIDLAPIGLKALGFDIEAIMAAGVRTISTRANSGGRSAFKTAPDLSWLTFTAKETGTVLEMRATSANLQDVLPGIVYYSKDGSGPWSQRYANCKRMDDAPKLPTKLLAWWTKCSTDLEFYRSQQRKFFEAISKHLGKPIKASEALSSGKELAFPAPGYRVPFNEVTDVTEILERHGYTQDERTGRWAPVTATGNASVREIPGKDGLWQSDHASDPLHGMFDAWTAHVRLDHGDDVEAAKAAWDVEADKRAAEDFEDLTKKAGDAMPPLSMDEIKCARLSPRVLVPGLLYADLRNRIAAGGVGKTTLALYEAVRGALGLEIWGRLPERPFKTILVTREDQREILAARLREIMNAMFLSDEDTALVLSRFNILDLTGISFRVSAIKGDVVVPDTAKLEWLIKTVQDFKPDWLIFDPLVSFGVGENRVNDSEQGIVEAFRALRNKLDCCVEGIHHTGKANSRDGALDQYAGRNGTALPDGCRMVAVLQPLGEAEWLRATGDPLLEGETGMVMALPKLSYAKQQESVYIKRRGFFFQQCRVKTVSPEAAKVERERIVMSFIRNEYEDGKRYSASDLEKCCTSIGLKRGEIREAVVQLKSAGKVMEVGGKGIRGTHLAPKTSAETSADSLNDDDALV